MKNKNKKENKIIGNNYNDKRWHVFMTEMTDEIHVWSFGKLILSNKLHVN